MSNFNGINKAESAPQVSNKSENLITLEEKLAKLNQEADYAWKDIFNGNDQEPEWKSKLEKLVDQRLDIMNQIKAEKSKGQENAQMNHEGRMDMAA